MSPREVKRRGVWGGALLAAVSHLLAAEVDITKLPTPATKQIDFDSDIRPIFEQSCYRCHGPERPKSGFRLDNREDALKGGDNGIAINPGDSARSSLIHYVARLVEDMEMPPAGKGDPLTPEQISILRAWIDQGAKWPAAAGAGPKFSFYVMPTLQWISVDGDEKKFRQHLWMKEGWSGGVTNLLLEEQLAKDLKLVIDGHILPPQDDYRIRLGIDKRDFGFARFGFETYRHYFDDTGGNHPGTALDPPSLDRELTLEVGRAWIDAGLGMPGIPKMTLGYEYQFKEGFRALSGWDHAGSFADYRAIGPAAKSVNENAHVVKFDISHDLNGYFIEDNFRAEIYDLDTRRKITGALLPDFGQRNAENYEHLQISDSFRVEKQVQPWLFLSAGYLYSYLDGEAGFRQETFVPSDPTQDPFENVIGNRILIDQHSHVVNLNTQLGPWSGLVIYGGVQNDWLRQNAVADLMAFGRMPSAYSTSLDKVGLEETAGLRFTKIPFTVLFAEGRFQQEGIDHFEQSVVSDGFDDQHDFLRDADSSNELKDFRLGASISPVKKASFHATYRHKIRDNSFKDMEDSSGLPAPLSGHGYPGFIRSRETLTDEIELKLTLQPIHWLKTTLKYQLAATDYETVTDSYFDPLGPLVNGGRIFAGNYDANIYSLNVTIKPLRRLFLSGTGSFAESRMVTGVNDNAIVVPYDGETYSVLSSATYLVSDTVDLTGSYTFAKSDYGQSNDALGFPVGITFERHGIQAGIRKIWYRQFHTRLQYLFYRYTEPFTERVNDYVAHGVLASMAIRLP